MRLTIRFDDNDRTLYAELGHHDEQEDISPESVRHKVEEAGYPNVSLNPKTIAELQSHAQQNKECSVALKSVVDATASVTIASDKRQAFLTLTAPDGGQPITMDLILDAIAKAGVADALLDQNVVIQCLERQAASNMCIAQAKLPVSGSDAVFIPLVESESTTCPDVDDRGVAHMLDTHHFVVVEAGTPLMKRVPATNGDPGLDVTGKEIKAAPAKDVGFAANLTGVMVSPEDPNVLVAAIKGHPIVLPQGVTVDSTLHVAQVDVHSGNIRFDGSLEVKGEVTAGMTIEVTGDVFVQGGVDRAAIHAGRSLKVGGGIVGGDTGEHRDEEVIEFRIKAGTDIEAKFVHLATLAAENNVVVKDYISHSYVNCGNQLLVGQDSGKGIIYGGRCEALHRVAVNQLGNEAYVPVHIIAGQLQELTKVYHDLEQELATRSQEVTQLEAILQKIQAGNPVLLGKIPLDKTQKIRNTIVAITDKVTHTEGLLRSLEPELELQKQAAIEVTRAVYPNSVMTINGTSREFSEKIRGDIWVEWGDTLLEQEKVIQTQKAEQAEQAELEQFAGQGKVDHEKED